MGQFLLWSLIGSVVLTVALNLLPALFPNAAAKADARLLQSLRAQQANRADPDTPPVRLVFPWKAMLIGSIALTVLVNVVGCAAG